MTNLNKKRDFIKNYKRAKNEELNKTHSIKPYHGKTDRYATCIVYTDGSAKGSGQSRDDKSFAGWGIYFKNILQNGKVIAGTKYNNLYNSDPLEAELRAVLEGLRFQKYPSHFQMVTDCADVVEGLRDIHQKVSEYHRLKGKASLGEISSNDRKKFRHLRIWNQINNEINTNDKIVSLNVRWVRSHTLDNCGADLPDPNDYEDPKERQLVEDCLGNEKADRCANRGAIKSVKSSLYFYVNVNQNESDRSRSLMTTRKNFMNSRFARDEAVRFLSEQPKDFLPKEVLESIFDQDMLDKIKFARDEITSGKEPSEVFKSVLKTKDILVFSESVNTRDFIEKCRVQVDRDSSSGFSV